MSAIEATFFYLCFSKGWHFELRTSYCARTNVFKFIHDCGSSFLTMWKPLFASSRIVSRYSFFSKFCIRFRGKVVDVLLGIHIYHRKRQSSVRLENLYKTKCRSFIWISFFLKNILIRHIEQKLKYTIGFIKHIKNRS